MMVRKAWRTTTIAILAALLFISCAGDAEDAPETFTVRFVTTKGDFTVEVVRAWAPKGADRFYNLVREQFYDEVRFFRVIRDPEPFMAQFGISGDPSVAARWTENVIEDDPVTQSNTRGMVSFATAGPNTRTTQLFINYGDNSRLDASGFAPFGKVIMGMEVVDQLYADYGEGAPDGGGPDQTRIEQEGNAYLIRDFPNLDYIRTARIVEE
jgi:peptidyl-prolyl cis-trans isomerase A (cyclophilin A)